MTASLSPATTDAPTLLTYKQAAEILQVSDRTVWQLVKDGQLRAVRFGRTVRIDRQDLDAFIEAAKAHDCGAPVGEEPHPHRI